MHPLTRRDFLHRSTTAGLATLTAGGSLLKAQAGEESTDSAAARPKIGAFTKSFQEWSIPEVARRFKEIGLDGLDLTVRPGGHIEPGDVEEKLPEAHRAVRAAGSEILFLTTGITDPDDDARRLLATAQSLGINRIKLGYYRYTGFGTLARQLAETKKRLAAVVKLAARYDVLPCVHVHSGKFIPSHGTQLYHLIEDFSPEEIGAYVDPLHMTREGGRDGWRQGLDLLAGWIALCAIKNFAWERAGRDRFGQRQWKTLNVPIADGVAPLPEFVSLLKTVGFRGPYSLHSEYKGAHSFRSLDTAACLQQTARDLAHFRNLL